MAFTYWILEWCCIEWGFGTIVRLLNSAARRLGFSRIHLCLFDTGTAFSAMPSLWTLLKNRMSPEVLGDARPDRSPALLSLPTRYCGDVLPSDPQCGALEPHTRVTPAPSRRVAAVIAGRGQVVAVCG